MSDTERGTFEINERCSDCCNPCLGQLGFKHWGPLVPIGSVGKFCTACVESRNRDYLAGKEPRPVGIPTDIANAEWIDLEEICIGHEPVLHVQVKYRRPVAFTPCIDDGGEVRFKIQGNDYWEGAPFIGPSLFGANPIYAHGNVVCFLQHRFEPHGKIIES